MEIWSPSINEQIRLTPSQDNMVETCMKLIPEFKIVVVKGDSSSGKYLTVSEVFRRLNASVELFDLCALAGKLTHTVSNQDLIEYFNSLINRIPSDRLGIVYIRYYNRIVDVLSDCNAKVRFFLPLILKSVVDNMPSNIHIVMTTQGCLLPEGLHWCIELTTTRTDMEHVLRPYCTNGILSQTEFDNIMKISRTVPVGRIIYCLKYALAMTKDETKNDNALIEAYRHALSRFSGSVLNVDRDITNPIPEDELVGMEYIMEEITTSIINPMQLAIPGLSLKKGMILCGPPGTGKTSIGRWLAHKIKGKFYLVNGDAGINGPGLVDAFHSTVKKARDNAPAVIFIDDGDTLFEQDDTYRTFLMVLDGIETNKRKDVCVIVTCMNMQRIPSSLLRGGRLEMALVTKLPDNNKIEMILERALLTMERVLADYNKKAGAIVSKYLNKNNFLSNISLRMTGLNCADVHRCVNDVSRQIAACQEDKMDTFDLDGAFNKCIRQVKAQYELCGKCESTNLDYRPQDTYIS